MIKYEFKTVIFDVGVIREDKLSALNEHGQEGWSVVAVVSTEGWSRQLLLQRPCVKPDDGQSK